jgi:phosphoribosylaminoimidazolecarboxamide formyltransferase/IMP cyclohydrolase
VSAFGSIIAVNGVVDIDFAVALAESKLFVEVLVAPEFTEEALVRLERRKQCRVMRAHAPKLPGLSLRSVHGGLLVQSPDQLAVDASAWKVATLRPPTAAELAQLEFAWRAVKHVKSNAIVFAQDHLCVGVGAGQMNRVDSVRIAASRAGDRARGAVVASDAFFPFPDGVEAAAAAGVTAVVQPGGSMRDEEVIAAADRLGLAMVFTGARHFLH